MKVWITKNALTKGIYEIEVEICEETSFEMIQDSRVSFPTYYHKPFWYDVYADALHHANVMRKKKKLAWKNRLRNSIK